MDAQVPQWLEYINTLAEIVKPITPCIFLSQDDLHKNQVFSWLWETSWIKEELTEKNELVPKGEKIVIPKKMHLESPKMSSEDTRYVKHAQETRFIGLPWMHNRRNAPRSLHLFKVPEKELQEHPLWYTVHRLSVIATDLFKTRGNTISWWLIEKKINTLKKKNQCD